jgi:cellulose biosynthesis protein BcsQ
VERPVIVNADGWVNVEDLAPTVVLYHQISPEEARWVYQELVDIPTLAVVDVKGGVKKTTASVHLAFAIHRATGKKVMIGDCDQYHSVADWRNAAEAAGDPWPDDIIVVSASGDNFHFDLVEAAKEHGVEYLVIDTPPNDPEAARRAMLGADVILSPSGPFPMDIRRLSYGLLIAHEVVEMRGGTIEPRALLTGVKMGTKLYKAARLYLDEVGLRLLGNMPIRDITAHAENFGTSLASLHDYEWVASDILPILNDTNARAIAAATTNR